MSMSTVDLYSASPRPPLMRYCVSAVFAVVAWLSVCLSVTLADCIHTAEDIVKLLIRPGNPITPHAPIPNSK